MKELSLTSIQNFLKDVEENGEFKILGEGTTEQDEVFAIAKARGILVKDSIDLAAYKSVYAFADIANGNGDVLPEDKVLKALPTLRGKPTNINHIETRIVGYLIDYKYIAKEKKIIVYGILFKHAFSNDFNKMQKEFGKKKLKTSYEIWTPKNQIKKGVRGLTYYGDLVFGGQAILFDKPPAFEEASVLKLTAECLNEMVLIKANKEDYELITADSTVQMTRINCKKCNTEFVPQNEMLNEHTCPNCKSVVDKEGNFLYPDQTKDYDVSCPNCGSSCKILEIKDNGQLIQCNSCQQKYEIEFAAIDSPLDYVSFLRIEHKNCVQCGASISIGTMSGVDNHSIKCNICGVKYLIDLSKSKKRKIKSISIVKEATKVMSKLQEQFKVVAKLEDITEQMALDFYYAPVEEQELINIEAAKWTRAFINDLPDEAFAVIEPAYVSGKTEDKNARHLPHHNKAVEGAASKSGKVTDNGEAIDLEHLKNAAARVNQLKPVTDSISAEELQSIGTTHIQKHYKELKKTAQFETQKKAIKRLVKEKMQAKKEKVTASEITDETVIGYEKEIASLKESEGLNAETILGYEKEIAELNTKILAHAEEINQIKVENEKVISMYKDNALEIIKRRAELGEFGKDMTDELILNDKEYEVVTLRKKVAELEQTKIVASDKVGNEPKDIVVDKEKVEAMKKRDEAVKELFTPIK